MPKEAKNGGFKRFLLGIFFEKGRKIVKSGEQKRFSIELACLEKSQKYFPFAYCKMMQNVI